MKGKQPEHSSFTFLFLFHEWSHKKFLIDNCFDSAKKKDRYFEMKIPISKIQNPKLNLIA